MALLAVALALTVWGLGAVAAPGPSALLPERTYTLTDEPGTAVFARNVWLAGGVVEDVSAVASAEACAAACRDVATCDVFNYGAVEVRCSLPLRPAAPHRWQPAALHHLLFGLARCMNTWPAEGAVAASKISCCGVAVRSPPSLASCITRLSFRP